MLSDYTPQAIELLFSDISPCPAAGQGVHTWLMSTANFVRHQGFDRIAAAELLPRIEALATRPLQGSGEEWTNALNTAFEENTETRRRIPRGTFDCNSLRAVIGNRPLVTPDQLASVSPMPTNISPTAFLEAMFHQGENILVFNNPVNQGNAIVQIGNPALEVPQVVATPRAGKGAYFLMSPVTGEFTENPARATDHNPSGSSRRCTEHCVRFPYALIECDREGLKPDFLTLLTLLPLPIAAIVDSGGKSYHAFVRVDAADENEWRTRASEISEALTILGADPAALSPVRLARLANCTRPTAVPGGPMAHSLQRLVYLDPNTDGTPIDVEDG